MRFLQFKISDLYITALTTVDESEEEMDDILELWATGWFDLQSPGGRCAAAHNIVALVARQASLR